MVQVLCTKSDDENDASNSSEDDFRKTMQEELDEQARESMPDFFDVDGFAVSEAAKVAAVNLTSERLVKIKELFEELADF